MNSEKMLEDAHNELLLYTIEHARLNPDFLHQVGVDAWAAQYANKESKPISVAFALVGLYLHLEKGFTGKEVQDIHVLLARKRKQWPHFSLPIGRGNITVFDVLNATPGIKRDTAIEKWAASVWDAWKDSHFEVADLIHAELPQLKF